MQHVTRDTGQVTSGLSGETVGLDLFKSDSVKYRLWLLKNKV